MSTTAIKGSARSALSKTVSRVALGAAMGLLVTGAALAQSQTGALRVTVAGPSGAPVSGATVVIRSPDSLTSRTGTTDAEGRVRVSGLDPATNYTVSVASPGFSDFSASNVAVVSGQDRSVGYALAAEGNTIDEVVITGRSLAAVDVTSAISSTTLTLNTVESLPTGRSYQSYLQLVPGVKPSSGGNPSSRSGINYSDIGGATGSSTDNLYFIDGVDVTDPSSGTFGANFNSEIIQEQQVLVGGLPAEYAGGSGLVSRVITKSGSNEWHGSVNYYLQNDSLVAKDKHTSSGGFKTYDTAVTLGGPIIKDRLWVFGSYQKKSRTDEVLDPTTGAVRREVKNDAEYGFFKATWQITDNDRLTGTFFNDPTDISGQSSQTILNNRDRVRKQGGDKYKLDYSHTWDNLRVNAYYFKHKGELSDSAADSSVRDNVSFRSTAGSTIAQRQLGGLGSNLETSRDRDEYGLNFEYYLDTSFGSHTFKGGYINTENVYRENGSVPGGATYASLAAASAGTTWAEYGGNSITWTTRSVSANDNARILAAINANATARGVVDTNGNGTVTADELNTYRFAATTGNPYGNVNVYRALRTVSGPYSVESKGQTLFFQDNWTWNRLTVGAGVRAEKWEHIASDGSKVATFDWAIAPRLNVVYDPTGAGRSKIFAFAGRYYDPVRNNMSDFAGALTGPVDEEQIYIGGQWLTFRTRGGATTPDALFSPNTKTPYTDEFQIGYATTIGSSIGVSATINHRRTRDILEDFDLALYSDASCTKTACGDHGYAYPGSLFYLPLSYFGYSTTPNSNYVIGTLPEGKRNYTGVELVMTKYKTTNWFGQVSYTYNSAKGNTNSDSNADYQGDWIALDPRAPNAYGPTPGNIKHQFKAYGSYDFPFGLQASGVFNWNSGALYTPAVSTSGRYFAPMTGTAANPVYEYGGMTDTWYLPGGIGSAKAPSYYTFDMRFKYEHALPIGKAEFFLDIFNVLDKQSTTDVMKLIAGDGIYDLGEGTNWVAPRRAYLGVRYSF